MIILLVIKLIVLIPDLKGPTINFPFSTFVAILCEIPSRHRALNQARRTADCPSWTEKDQHSRNIRQRKRARYTSRFVGAIETIGEHSTLILHALGSVYRPFTYRFNKGQLNGSKFNKVVILRLTCYCHPGIECVIRLLMDLSANRLR